MNLEQYGRFKCLDEYYYYLVLLEKGVYFRRRTVF